MRLALLVLIGVTLSGFHSAKADPYRWCAQYGGRMGGTNCGFFTWEQCHASVWGVGGFCSPNPWYDGKPITVTRPAIVRPKQPS